MAQVDAYARRSQLGLHTTTVATNLTNVEPPLPPRRLLMVGGGHAHLLVFDALLRRPLSNCAITIVADRADAIYSGMVPGFVAGQYQAHELTFDLRAWAQAIGAEFLLGAATGFDAEQNLVHLADGSALPYDLCSWNIGSGVAQAETPGVREFTLPTRPIATFVEEAILRLEEAMMQRGNQPLRLLVVGGGAAGVELAFCLQQRALQEGAKVASTTILCANDQILTHASAATRGVVLAHAKKCGIEIRCNSEVVAVHAGNVESSSKEQMAFDLCIWATGAAAHLESGWIPVNAQLQHVNHPNVFAAGDCAHLTHAPNTPKAGVFAVREGPILAHNLRAYLDGSTKQDYRPQSDFLSLLNFGDGHGVGSKWGFAAKGKWLHRWKDRIDRRFMQRFQIRTKR